MKANIVNRFGCTQLSVTFFHQQRVVTIIDHVDHDGKIISSFMTLVPNMIQTYIIGLSIDDLIDESIKKKHDQL